MFPNKELDYLISCIMPCNLQFWSQKYIRMAGKFLHSLTPDFKETYIRDFFNRCPDDTP